MQYIAVNQCRSGCRKEDSCHGQPDQDLNERVSGVPPLPTAKAQQPEKPPKLSFPYCIVDVQPDRTL